MKHLKKSLLSLILTVAVILGTIGNVTSFADEKELTIEQQNAIAMLNYITVLTQEINSSKNSRVCMEEAYSTLINNTYPNAVDSRTLNQMTGLLDTMEGYRMINVKRERLQYIYEQSQAQAIRSAIPNPIGMISTVQSCNPAALIASVVYMAVDSYTSYTSYTAQAEQQFLEAGWALDDEEAEILHESRKGTFSYMVEMVNDYSLPGDLTLTEDTVNEFVKYKNSDNLASKIQFLESNKNDYKSYGGYWLTLADCYYNNGDYQKCIDAVTTYEKMEPRIFRRDYELARVLPLAIVSADEVYGIRKYAPYVSEHVQTILDNTDHSDWALRYFAAQTLVDLYTETKAKSYLQDAYTIILDNVNYLVEEQQNQNALYLSDVQEERVPDDADKEEKTQIKEYNRMLKETRKTEMPPVYEPLMLNCDLLFSLADQLNLTETEQKRIDSMLHPGGKELFLTKTIDDQYWFNNPDTISAENIDIDYAGKTLSIPAAYMTADSAIKVTITNPENSTQTIFEDWKINTVSRESEDIGSFEASYLSNESKKFSWVPDTEINIEISPREDKEISYKYKFKTEETKDAWYDHIKIWENGIKFVRVE